MGLKTMTLKSGGTSAVTGGTDKVFADDGQTVNGGVHLICPATADFRVREEVTARSNPSALDKAGKYTKSKRFLTLVVPRALADGTFTRDSLRLELTVHPEGEATAVTNLTQLGAQLFYDSDVTAFWSTGSTA